MTSKPETSPGDCLDGHQWHDIVDGQICAACLATRPAEPITPDAEGQKDVR